MPKVLITGFNGFVGRHAAIEFRSRGYEIHGVTYGQIDEKSKTLVDRTYTCDLSDEDSVMKLDLDRNIDVILNLAGIATNTGGGSETIHKINVGVHVNLCKLIGSLSISPKYIGVSSSTVYDANQQLPLTENSTLKNLSEARPYEASKIVMEKKLLEHAELDILIARPFNHIGAGQGLGFLIPDLATQIHNSKKNGGPIMVGNLNSKRDYTHVKDVVRAYADLAEMDKLNSGETFNICSGKSVSGNDILMMLLEEMEAKESVSIEVDSSKLRGPNDVDDNYGSYNKIHAATGWEPSQNGVENAIQDFVSDFMTKIN